VIPLHDPDIRRRRSPHVTYALIAINVVIAGITFLALSGLDELAVVYRYGAIPSELTGGPEFGVERVEWMGRIVNVDLTSPIPTLLTMFTSMFLHGGWLHLAGNMLFLWVFGDNVEDRLGHVGYLLFYLATGVAAVWTQVYVSPDSEVPMIGASGAISGVLGAYLVLFPRSRIHTLIMMGFIFHTRLPAVVLLGGWILFQLFVGTATLGLGEGGGVAYFAHIGGFAAGMVGVWVLRVVRAV
jgi:membrane associated rhomboid family serine protease